jgi:hypothetical protein
MQRVGNKMPLLDIDSTTYPSFSLTDYPFINYPLKTEA